MNILPDTTALRHTIRWYRTRVRSLSKPHSPKAIKDDLLHAKTNLEELEAYHEKLTGNRDYKTPDAWRDD